MHTVVGTSANEYDVTQTENLLTGEEETVNGDADHPSFRYMVRSAGRLRSRSRNHSERLCNGQRRTDGPVPGSE